MLLRVEVLTRAPDERTRELQERLALAAEAQMLWSMETIERALEVLLAYLGRWQRGRIGLVRTTGGSFDDALSTARWRQ